MHAVVYTAIFGGYDVLKQPVPQDQSCDFICFTDGRPSRQNGWRIIRVRRDRSLHPRMQAKQFKLLSHRIFPRGRLAWRYAPFSRRRPADLSIWVDASIQIKSSTFVRDLRAALGRHDWAMFVHPDRDCIYDEALFSTEMIKYQGLPIERQAESYRSIVPPHGGLYACTVIVRREPAREQIESANELWWKENLKWTYQDQLSLPYVVRKIPNAEPTPIPGNLWSNGWFDIMPHNAET
jgi:hypothetical protein